MILHLPRPIVKGSKGMIIQWSGRGIEELLACVIKGE